MKARLTKSEIRRLFVLLERELAKDGVQGEVYLVGGAVMCLAFNARDATRDMDGVFQPARAIREAAGRVAAAAGVPATWLNDAVKGFLSARGEFDSLSGVGLSAGLRRAARVPVGDEMRGASTG